MGSSLVTIIGCWRKGILGKLALRLFDKLSVKPSETKVRVSLDVDTSINSLRHVELTTVKTTKAL